MFKEEERLGVTRNVGGIERRVFLIRPIISIGTKPVTVSAS